MAYAYCRKCDTELSDPTFADYMHMKIECHSCGADFELSQETQADALIELEARLSVIEERLRLEDIKASF